MPDNYIGTITLASVQDADTLYTWIAYSNGTNVTAAPGSDTKQIGFAYNQASDSQSTNYSDYTWSDYMGADGSDGIGVASIVEQYYLSSSSASPTGGDWSSVQSAWTSGSYYWTRSKIGWTNNTTTYTDPVLAQGLNEANNTAYIASTDLAAYMSTTNSELSYLQSQIDGQIEVWYFESNPGDNPDDPSLTWNTTEEKERHLGDLYYNVSNGHSWRWLKTDQNQYVWQQIPDGDAAAALAAAQAAQTTADSKKTVFTVQPTPPYHVGDLWVDGSEVKYCNQERVSGSYVAADWILTATDDTNALTQVDVYYGINDSASSAPSGYDNPSSSANWSTTPPTWQDGKYIWSVTVAFKGGQAQTPTPPVNITGAKGASGADAPYITLTGTTNVIAYDRQTGSYTPSSTFRVQAAAANTSLLDSGWTYSINGGAYSSTVPSGLARSSGSDTVVVTPSLFSNKTVAIKAASGSVNDIYTITRVESGKNGADGSDGTSVSITSTEVKYQVGASGTQEPSGTWQTNVPSVAAGSFLWTRTIVNYSDNNSTTSYSVSYDGTNGTNGTSPTVSSTLTEYQQSTSGTTVPTGSWDSAPPSAIAGRFMWTRTTVTYSDSATAVSYSVSKNGTNGSNGYNTATVNLYKKGDVAPAAPTTSLTYKFSDRSLTGDLNGWSQSIPSTGSGVLWLTSATALATTASDTIASTEWSPRVQLEGVDGADGSAGASGLNQATIYLYKRSASTPSSSLGSSTYTFASGTLSNIPTGWSQAFASGSDPCYVTTGVAISSASTASVTWATPVKLVEDGQDGQDGQDGADAIEIILSNESHTLTAAADGTISSYTGASTQVYVYEGTTDKSSDYSITKSDPSDVTSTVDGKVVTVTSVTNGIGGVITITVKKDGTTIGTKSFTISVSKAGATGANGQDGVDGSQFWTTTTAPTNPSSGVYIFTTSTLVGDGSTDPKVGDIVLYSVYRYTITGVGDTTVTTGNRQSLKGNNGYSSAEVCLYKRSATAITTAPDGGQTYTFSTGALNTVPTGWSRSIPASDGNPCYVTVTYLTSTSSTATVSSWATPVKLVEDGANGKTWNINTNVGQIYKFARSNTSLDDIALTNDSFSFSVTSVSGGTSTLLAPGTDYTYKISLIPVASDANIGSLDFSDLATNFNSITVKNGETTSNLKTLSIEEDALSKTITFNLKSSFIFSLSSGTNNWYSKYQDLCKNFNCMFIICVYDNSVLIATEPVFYSFGVDADGAKFSINAADITAAINNAGFRFSGDGLTITNGSLVINDNNGNNYFSFSPALSSTEMGKLEIQGNAIFSGELRAATGSFAGEITAETGSIGGFTISADRLTSTNGNVQLLGTNGKIIADDIDIGTGAVIKEYIQVGDAYIRKPTDENGHEFIEAGEISLTDTGILTLGNITINGSTSTFADTDGNGFIITPDTAIFNNIVARGKISTAIFEKDSMQLVGGLMLFKPSYKIESISGTTITLDKDFDGTTNSYVQIINKAGTPGNIYKISSISGNIITVDRNVSSGFSLYDLGENGSLLVGVNSTGTEAFTLRRRGITFSEFIKPTGTLTDESAFTSTLRTFLGDLGASGITSGSGYGLYSDNVILNGSITTKAGGKYTGINTVNTVNSTKSGSGDPIIFWGGANSTDESAIQEAPFQVSQNGHLYANNGWFTGSVFINGDIEGSIIRAAKIYGTGDEEHSSGLTIYNTEDGISFHNLVVVEEGQQRTEIDTETFRIGNHGLSRYIDNQNNYFISIDENGVNGNFYSGVFGNLLLKGSSLKLNGNENYGIVFEDNGFSFKVDSSTNSLITKKSDTIVNSSIFKASNDIQYGDSFNYKKVTTTSGNTTTEIGYDLYIGG